MNKKTLSILSATVGLALLATTLLGEDKTLDQSNGSYAGTVWFVYSSPTAEEAAPFAAVALSRLPDSRLDAAFALREVEGAFTADAVEVEKAADLKGEQRDVLAVKVGPQAYDQIRWAVASWPSREHRNPDPAAIAENLFDEVARAAGLKAPYRSALRGAEPLAYLVDLARTNR